MGTLFQIVFWISFVAMATVWLIYPMALALVARIKGVNALSAGGAPTPSRPECLSIIIAAHDEEGVIEQRLQNIIDIGSQDFAWEIVVMADGCADGTVEKVKAMAQAHPDHTIKVYETTFRGRANAHNEAYALVSGDVLVFTDAETVFDPGFLDAIGHAFDNPQVGYASGGLGWINEGRDVNASHFGLYWRYEVMLRELETATGIGAVGTGACCAVRSELYQSIPADEDADFTTPLDVVLQGRKVVFVPEAKAWDVAAADSSSEFRNRVRMTAKNFKGTMRMLSALCPSWECVGIIFHKIGRWLTPFLAISTLVSGTILCLIGSASMTVETITMASWLLVLLAFAGYFHPTLPIAGQMWSFAVGNAAFAIGVVNALRGKTKVSF